MVASPPSVQYGEYVHRRSPLLPRSRSDDPWSQASHCVTLMSRPLASASPSSRSVLYNKRSRRVRGSYHTHDGLGHTLYGCAELTALVGIRSRRSHHLPPAFSPADFKSKEASPFRLFVG